MRYLSTRGRAEPAGFVDALLGSGRAPDGGLWAPETWPQLSPQEIEAAAVRPLAETAAEMMLRYCGAELDPEAVADAAREAAASFVHDGVAPLREVAPNLWLHDLTWGPTGSAADFEMQVVARLAEAALAVRRERRVFVAAGADALAAAEAFAGRARTGLVAVIPAAWAGEPLGRRLAQIKAPNVRAVAVEADATSVTAMAAELHADLGLSDVARLASAGPENPARMALRAAAWIAVAARLGAPGRAVTIAAPAEDGALAAGAWAARRMGLAAQVVLAAAAPSPFAAMFGQGGFHAAPGATPAALLERIYFEAVDREALETARAMTAVSELGGFDLAPRARAALAGLAGAEVDAVEAARAMVEIRNGAGEFVSPETALVAAAARRLAPEGATPLIVPELAHPGLVASPVLAALGEAPPAPRRRAGAEAEPVPIERLPADLFALKAWVRDFAGLSRAA